MRLACALAAPLLVAPPRAAVQLHAQTNEAYAFALQLRGAKTALRRALQAEEGVLPEDGVALVQELHNVNPTGPNPTADADLWEGSFDLLNSPLADSFGALNLSQRSALVSVSAESAILTVALQSDAVNAAVTTGLSRIDCDFAVTVATDDKFRIRLRRLALLDANGMVLESEVADGLLQQLIPMITLSSNAEPEEADEAETRTLADVDASVLYLDQDLFILQVDAFGSADGSGDTVEQAKEPTREQLLIMSRGDSPNKPAS